MDATTQAAAFRLNGFLDEGLKHYANKRNFDWGSQDRSNVSTLSPYIRHRLILEQNVIAAALASGKRSEKFVDEVFWRAYFKGWLQHHPSVWDSYREDVAGLVESIANKPDLQERYNQAIAGNTGIDCFDAWAQELVTTGYLHNHARMWFASIWIFTLQLPWQMGADFFLRHLLDGDPASNTLSWRWVGGLHTRGKTYLARVSNIANYTDGRFAPHGQLATEARPLTEDITHETRQLEFPGSRTPGERIGLLLTEDDLSAATLLDGLQPLAVIGLAATRRRSPLPIGERAYEFATQAVEHAVEDTAASFGVAGDYLAADVWLEPVVHWAKEHELDDIVLARPPIGPAQEAFDEIRPALESEGIGIVEFTRDYDRETWKHANRGFFKLKKQSGRVIERLRLDEKADNLQSNAGQRDFIDELAS